MKALAMGGPACTSRRAGAARASTRPAPAARPQALPIEAYRSTMGLTGSVWRREEEVILLSPGPGRPMGDRADSAHPVTFSG